MPTNEERREVARRLRGDPYDTLIPYRTGIHFGMGCHEAANRFWDMCERIKSAGDYDIAYSTRSVLADLIEPEPERTCRNLSEYQDCDCFTCSNCGESYEIKRLEYNIDEYCTIDDAIRALDYDSCDCDVFYCLNCGSELVDDELHDQ